MARTNRQAICDVLLRTAQTNKQLVVLCSDSRGSASMTPFAQKYPDQFVEVGIAEQNLVGVAAGLAMGGKQTFAMSPASFLTTRSYEQVKVDVAYNCANVKLVGISGGVSYGALGMTHHSLQDYASMCALEGMRVYVPSDDRQTEKLVEALVQDDKPAYIRVSRQASTQVYDDSMDFELDKACVLSEGKDAVIVACGDMVANAVGAAEMLRKEGLDVGVIDMYCLKPFDKKTLLRIANNTRVLVTAEEHYPHGGLGSLVAQTICAEHPMPVLQLSFPDEHLISGENREIFHYYSLDSSGIAASVKEFLR